MAGGTKLLQVLAGRPVWPPPLWLMRQAGRYLPEYRALRATVPDFVTLCTTPRLAAEVTLQPIRRFGFDAAILFSDILIVPWAMGQPLAFQAGEGPMLPPIRDAAGIATLRTDRVPDATAPIMETVRLVRSALDSAFPGTALIGFAGAPFTVACYMVEGGGSRDFAATRLFAYTEPALFQELVDILVEATIAYLSDQAEAGADALMLFDTWAGLLPPDQFVRWVIAPTEHIVRAVTARHPEVPIIGFPRLAGLMLRDYARTGVKALGLDTSVDLVAACGMLPSGMAIQGNLDPLAVAAGGEAMKRATNAILTAMCGRPFIFNLGHGLIPETPPEHVTALKELVHAG